MEPNARQKQVFDRLEDWYKDEARLSFASRPARETWDVRLAEALDKGRDQGCDAQPLSTMGPPFAGFGCKINCFVDEILLAIYAGTPLVVASHQKHDHFVQKTWQTHFENTAGVPVCKRAPFVDNMVRPYRIGNWLAEGLAEHDPEYLADLKAFAVIRAYKYSADVRNRVETSLAQLGVEQGSDYVGVHVRRGDKVFGDLAEAELISTESYAAAIREHLGTSGSRVYLASDDPGARSELQELLGSGVTVIEAPRLPQDTYNSTLTYSDPEGREEEILYALLTDLEALRRSRAFVGTASSNLGRLVYILRGGPAGGPAVSLDVGGNFLAGLPALQRPTGPSGE